MKKFYFIAIALIIAAIAAYYLHETNSSTLHRRDTHFHINDIAAIDRILIETQDNSLTLIREGENWSVNNEIINQDRLRDLLVLAQKLEVISPAAKSDVSKLKIKLNNSTNVSFYAGSRLINSYRLCSSEMKVFASRNKSDKIFQVEARGYPNVDLTKIFSADALYWTNRKIINFNPEEITLIKINYPNNPEKDLKLTISSKGNYHLSDQHDMDVSESADHKLISIYLQFFHDLPYYPLEDKEKAEINRLIEPFFILLVESNKQAGIELYAYKKINPENGKSDKIEFYGKVKDKGIVKLKYSDFDPVLMELKDFLKK